MDNKIRAGIIGGAGYTGGEMLRLLLRHPAVDIAFIHSRSNAGMPVSAVHTDLAGDTDSCFSAAIDPGVDVLFLCVGHGEAAKFFGENSISASTKVVDLSQDFRLPANAHAFGRQFVYGLPEVSRGEIEQAISIANPGCFATAIQLGLLPLAKAGLLNEVHTTGITGATGAGQRLQPTSHFPWRVNNVQAYKSLAHQHIGEITATLNKLQPGNNVVNFIPWRGDFTRGIYVSSYTHCDMGIDQAYELYSGYYATHPFTHIIKDTVDMKQVVNTNKCLISLEKVGNNLVIHSAIDNLLKGASGQAVQNMNLMFGLQEDAGLQLKATAF